MPTDIVTSPRPERRVRGSGRAGFPGFLSAVSIVLLGACLFAWTILRVDGGLPGWKGLRLTLATIEGFGWTAIGLGAIFLIVLTFRAVATIRRRAGLRIVLPWIALVVLAGLVWWTFDGIRIAAIGCHAALSDLPTTRNQAFQLSARLYPLLPYFGLQTALMPEPVWPLWRVGRLVGAGTLWVVFLSLTAAAAAGLAMRQWKDLPGWLLLLPSVAGLGYLIVRVFDPLSAHAFLAPLFSVKTGYARADVLYSNLLSVSAAILLLFAGFQIYRLVRASSVARIAEAGLDGIAPAPRALTLFLVACLLLPFADLYGQFDLVMKNRELSLQADYQVRSIEPVSLNSDQTRKKSFHKWTYLNGADAVASSHDGRTFAIFWQKRHVGAFPDIAFFSPSFYRLSLVGNVGLMSVDDSPRTG